MIAAPAARSVPVLNKVVLKWAPLPVLAVVLMTALPSQALAARPKPLKQAHPVSAQKAAPATATTARKAAVNAAYTSAEPGCFTARRKLWTEDGWIVRRITSCR
jgi:hypothetical protein